MYLTLEEAKNLRYGDILHSVAKNNQGKPYRYKVNGKVKLWKRDSGRIYVPLKRGLYEYDSLTENDFCDFRVGNTVYKNVCSTFLSPKVNS